MVEMVENERGNSICIVEVRLARISLGLPLSIFVCFILCLINLLCYITRGVLCSGNSRGRAREPRDKLCDRRVSMVRILPL